jgi:hypothetical protein
MCGSHDATVGPGGTGPWGFKIQNSRFKINSGEWDSKFKIQDSKFKIQDSR